MSESAAKGKRLPRGHQTLRPISDRYMLDAARGSRVLQLPELPYRPQDPPNYRPGIGVIGCGGISYHHLRAYRDARYNVVALCNRHPEPAEERRRQFFPKARVFSDYKKLLSLDSVEVVDIATHPHERPPLIEAALRAGKHVLSQKPFVVDLDVGERLVDLAGELGLKLAVNQNGRWAPHFAWMRHAVKHRFFGRMVSAHFAMHWDHSWVAGTPFDDVRHLILFDFGIHWFDVLGCLMLGRRPTRVYASTARASDQTAKPPLLAQALVEYGDTQASMVFGGNTKQGAHDDTILVGTNATVMSSGYDLGSQTITVSTRRGSASPHLEGSWFPGGFHGAMAELLRSIVSNRQPIHAAKNNLKSLALCFAACASADDHEPKVPGSVRRLPE